MSTTPTIPMLAPDGSTSGDIPQANMQQAISSGAIPAVAVTSPDGKLGYVPSSRLPDALKAGAKIANPSGEGMYKMVGPDGKMADIPFSNVRSAEAGNYQVVGPDAVRYQKDSGQSAIPGDGNTFQNFSDALVRYAGHPEDRGVGQPNAANRFGTGLLQSSLGAIAHPIDTLEGIGSAIAHPIDAATNMVRGAIADPATAAGNIIGGAALGELGGAAGELAGKVAPPVVGRALLLGKTPEAAYESALKPSTTLSQADRAGIVKTGLEQGIPVSKTGLENIGDLIDGYNQKIKAMIDADPLRPIDPQAVATRADAAKAKFAQQVNATPDLNAIDASQRQFLLEQGAKPAAGEGPMTPAPPMSAADAQAMKQGTYRVLAGKFGEQGSAAVEAQKALARGLKEEIATQFPEITKLNANESRLLDLQPILERAVNRNGNHQILGIGTPIVGMGVKAATGSGAAGAIASAIKGVVDNPLVKSKLAIAISKGGNIPYSEALGKVSAYSAALGNSGNNANQ